MKKNIKLFLQGFLIGIGKIIPGVSGSMIAITFNLYEKMIHAINHPFKKENFFFLFPIGTGIITSIIFFSNIITYLLKNYYLSTILLFIGFIMGGIPNIKSKSNYHKKKNIFFCFLSIFILFSISLTNIQGKISMNFITHFFMGMLESFTMIVPGISGTALYMIFGYYEFYLDVLSYCMTNISTYLPVILPFVLGMIISVVLTSKIISYLFCKYKEETYALIFGFSISSVFLLFKQTFQKNYTTLEIIISLILLLFGYLLQKHLEKK